MRPDCRLLLFLPVFLAACSGLPEIRPLTGIDKAGLAQACLRPFPDTPMQYLHALEAFVAGKNQTGILGLVRVWPQTRHLRCVIMTVEGLVVFDARHDSQLVVDRALPPFDRPGMAEGLVADLEMMFLPPRGRLLGSGHPPSGDPVCRYLAPDKTVSDVVLLPDGRWQLCRYDAAGRLNRTVSVPVGHGAAGRTPSRLQLTAHGIPGYRLTMDLIESMPLAAGDKP
ncbi:MAG: hypothetical protein JEZ11_09010 [Desulfobacterales bacterium]|nr:hypothetical protein [Desulfobacterales bacterium]